MVANITNTSNRILSKRSLDILLASSASSTGTISSKGAISIGIIWPTFGTRLIRCCRRNCYRPTSPRTLRPSDGTSQPPNSSFPTDGSSQNPGATATAPPLPPETPPGTIATPSEPTAGPNETPAPPEPPPVNPGDPSANPNPNLQNGQLRGRLVASRHHHRPTQRNASSVTSEVVAVTKTIPLSDGRSNDERPHLVWKSSPEGRAKMMKSSSSGNRHRAAPIRSSNGRIPTVSLEGASSSSPSSSSQVKLPHQMRKQEQRSSQISSKASTTTSTTSTAAIVKESFVNQSDLKSSSQSERWPKGITVSGRAGKEHQRPHQLHHRDQLNYQKTKKEKNATSCFIWFTRLYCFS